MRVLHIINNLWVGNGAAGLLTSLVPYQIKQGYQVDIISLSDSLNSRISEIKDINCNYIALSNFIQPKYKPYLVFKLIPYITQYDVVHVHQFPSIYWVAIAKIISRSKCKLIMTEHSTLNNRQKKSWLRPIEKYIYNKYQAIIAISYSVQQCIFQYVTTASPIYVIENGINLLKYKESPIIARNSLGLSEDNILLMQVARFDYQKDQETVLRTMVKLPDKYHVVFIGSGILLDKHKELSRSLGVEKRCHFLGVRNDVPSLLKMADIVIMSSHFEGFGLVAVEGMAAGKPVIGSDVPGLSEVIQGAGITFPVGNDNILAREIMKISTDKNYAKQIIQACIKRADKYDISIMAQRYNEVYHI